MKRILHLINCLERGGAEHVVLQLVRYRDAERFAPTVAYLFGEGELRTELEAAGAEVHPLGFHRAAELPLALARLSRLAYRVRPELIHTHLLHSEILGALLGRALGIPVVGTAHNVFWDDPSYPWVLRQAYRGALRSNRHTVAISEAVRRKLESAGVSSSRITTVYNGVPPTAPLARGEARRRLGLPGGLVLGAVGNLYRYKGHDLLLEALAKLVSGGHDLQLAVVGEGGERGPLREQARALGVADRLHLPGTVPSASALLSAFDVFVQPSRTEGLGLALLEALAAGIPAAAFAVGGIPEVAGTPPAVALAPAEDPAALARAIEGLLTEGPRRERLIRDGRRRAERFSARAMTDAYERIYGDVMLAAHPEAA